MLPVSVPEVLSPGSLLFQYSSAVARLPASSPSGLPSATARNSGARTAGWSPSEGAATASAAQNATCASLTAPFDAFHKLASACVAARHHASKSIFFPLGHLACSCATPGNASASARITSACTWQSRVESSTFRPSTDDVSALSANAAPLTASTAATRASALTATNRGSPCNFGNSWCSCAKIEPSLPVNQLGSRRAIRSTAVTNAS